MLRKLIYDEEAQGMTEYILIVALVAVVCVVVIKLFGQQIRDLIKGSSDKIKENTN